jgi:hypothetical protein
VIVGPHHLLKGDHAGAWLCCYSHLRKPNSLPSENAAQINAFTYKAVETQCQKMMPDDPL